jgi:hypothetical protein
MIDLHEWCAAIAGSRAPPNAAARRFWRGRSLFAMHLARATGGVNAATDPRRSLHD